MGAGVAMTCEHDTDPAACPRCLTMARLEHEGRNLADLLDGEIDPEVRASIMGATTSADVAPEKGVRPWSVEARRVVDGVGF